MSPLWIFQFLIVNAAVSSVMDISLCLCMSSLTEAIPRYSRVTACNTPAGVEMAMEEDGYATLSCVCENARLPTLYAIQPLANG